MKSSLIIILTLLLFTKIQNTAYESFSISNFIDFIQENGIWEILFQVRLYFGVDISIELCRDFSESPHCEEVVRVYMNNSGTRGEKESVKYLDRSQLYKFLSKNHYLIILKTVFPTRFPRVNDKLQIYSKK